MSAVMLKKLKVRNVRLMASGSVVDPDPLDAYVFLGPEEPDLFF